MASSKTTKARKTSKKARDSAEVSTRGKGSTLVVVESPAKAKTIKKYLGSGYVVKASVGHVMDLPKSKIGVEVGNGFQPDDEGIDAKKKVVAELKAAAKGAQLILLATDPDREGEAIAWHVYEQLKRTKVPAQRILFNEITKKAIQEAIQKPLQLNRDLYDAQQARRVLDRLVGYQISPILWKKVRRGLSAGRVQSVAVRLVVEREEEIAKFVPVEYWSIEADLRAALPPQFRAKLIRLDGQKAEIASGEVARPLVETLKREKFVVAEVTRKERRRNAPPPFITSKLQQDAANRLGFTAKKTMTLAQRLYEGVELGDEGQTALITYMRTDSVRLSPDAVAGARAYVAQRWGKEYLPGEPVQFKTKKSAQDAHEAIRPTALDHPPERVKPFLEKDMFRLYELIWNRFIACQMVPAVFDQTTADIKAGRATFRATGQILKFPGYLAVYGQEAEQPQEEAGAEKMEGEDEEKGDVSRQLPPLEHGQRLELVELIPEQHFTQPPPRFTEASLVKELEEKGIGRPSTYAAILSTIQDKEYVEKKENRFYPTDLGKIVNELLVDDLPTEEVCPTCGKPMLNKRGRFGRFLACSDYPNCKTTRPITLKGVPCPDCGGGLAERRTRFGKSFFGCVNYPNCKFAAWDRPIPGPCPQCGKPYLLSKYSKKEGPYIACPDKECGYRREAPEPGSEQAPPQSAVP